MRLPYARLGATAVSILLLGVSVGALLWRANTPGGPWQIADDLDALAVQRLLDADVSWKALAELVDPTADASEPTAVWGALMPGLPIGRLAHDDRSPAACNALADAAPRRLEFAYSGSEPVVLRFPIDWSADPYGDRSWRFRLQSLDWLKRYTEDRGMLAVVGCVIVDWARQQLRSPEPLDFTWYDHSIARRSRRVAEYLKRLSHSGEPVEFDVIDAALYILVTHTFALASGSRYPRPPNNHGVMMDLQLLRLGQLLMGLRDRERLLALGRHRLAKQAAASVTEDGIHVENSPGYHLLFAELMSDAIAECRKLGVVPPPEVIAARNLLLAVLPYLVQPNLTLVQFGNTTNNPVDWHIEAQARAATDASPDTRDALRWLASRGANGSPPRDLDRVFGMGGYASFRDAWSGPGGIEDVFVANVKCSRHTTVHYHSDDGTVTLFAFGQEILVDTGFYSFETTDPLAAHQLSALAHNVLVVDDQEYDYRLTMRGEYSRPGPWIPPRFDAFQADGDTPWVRCRHANFERIGVKNQARTVARIADDALLIVDHLRNRTAEPRTYDQYLHLHPTYDSVEPLDAGRWLITSSDPDAPRLVVSSANRDAELLRWRGRNDATTVQGWYYPEGGVAVPALSLAIRTRSEARETVLPLVLRAFRPTAAVGDANEMHAAFREAELEVTWRRDGQKRTLTLPRSLEWLTLPQLEERAIRP